MIFRNDLSLCRATAVTLALALAGCGGGGGGSDSASVSPAFDSGYNAVGDLSGRTRVRYSRGGADWATEFVYRGQTETRGVMYATGTGSHVTSALSVGASFAGLACTTWAALEASTNGTAGDLGETYLCNWGYVGGGRNWYAMSISESGAVTGRNVFIAAGSAINGIAQLVAGQGAVLVGEHEPNYRDAAEGQRSAIGVDRLYEELEAAVLQ